MEELQRTTALKSKFIRSEISGEKGPILLVLHGLGDSLEGYTFLPSLLRIPQMNYLLVNAPDRYFTGYSWFDLTGGPMDKGVYRSRDLLYQVLDSVRDAGWALEHVGVLGFSQGCLMTLDLACTYPEKLGAFVGISGFAAFLDQYPERLSPVARDQSILVTHGTSDPLLPLENTQAQIDALKGMGMKIDFKVYRKEHTIDPRQEVDDIRSFLKSRLLPRHQ